MRRLQILAMLVVVGRLAAACSSPAPSGMLETLGDGEGELNMVIGRLRRGRNE